ncbi:hypothetical protein QIS99_12320 [Streptomyces sp. B-S-A8]|uniref:Uncharacterized protein n=1 Tax=Streptomyces solicavernae TaxID=3043614 RepID=A0ABT6RRF0_9ACTN|nr:hypothetical protein [Streptomyces sp. B-S-A8]MDI3386977.1 hypothetical protein [Streptomyces sp. B-S-A8]
MPRPHTTSTPDRPARTASGDVVGWAAFSCVLVPVVLVVYGTSLGGAAGSALGLAAVTAVCRILLRRSERSAAQFARGTEREAVRGRRAGRGAHPSRRSAGGRNRTQRGRE